MTPFLQVLTRCYQRPGLLIGNMASMAAQSSDDWEQTLLVDTVGRGIGWSHSNLAAHAPLLRGEYIWILDDDDECVDPNLVEELRTIAAEHAPDVIVVRMDHGHFGVQPDAAHWQKPAREGHLGVSACIVRRAVWQAHAAAWTERYAGDFDFFAAIFAGDPEVYWHDVIASRVRRISYGAQE